VTRDSAVLFFDLMHSLQKRLPVPMRVKVLWRAMVILFVFSLVIAAVLLALSGEM
jgi:hypothetical protein